VFVTCGGYGSVMLSISHRLPMVAAGLNEGKNEINARLGYFKLGKDLKTDRPKPQQIREAVQEVMGNPVYRQHIEKLRTELIGYNTLELCEGYIRETLPAQVRELLEATPQKKMLETEV
jgi:UDP:flavonoid glycosyltransferase YjiC (YdhE family)